MEAVDWTALSVLAALMIGAIGCLSRRIGRLEERMNGRIDRLEERMNAHFAQLDERYVRHLEAHAASR